MAIDGGRWWPPRSVTGPASLKFVLGNAIFLRNQKGDANNVDVLHTLSEMKMARSKIWMILDRTRTNTWSDNMMGNNSVESW